MTNAPENSWARLRLRFLHRLFTPGPLFGATDAARLRGWARVLNWRDAVTSRQRFYLARRALWTPVRAWGEAGEAVDRFGVEVQSVAGITPQAQRRQLWWLAVRHGLNAISYLDYQLYRPERRARASAYVQEQEFYCVGLWLNRITPKLDQYPIADKLAFPEWCRAHGLPAVPTLLQCDGADSTDQSVADQVAVSLPRRDLFSKPSDDTGGHGTESWRYAGACDGSDCWVGRDGKPRSAAELLCVLAQTSRALPRNPGKPPRLIILQPRLINHKDLLPLTPGGLCTARLVTYRAPQGRPRVLLAAYKMPTGNCAADNFHLGGIVAPIDLATGRLGSAIRRDGRLLAAVERHPDTDVVIDGQQLPWWPETVALANRALEAAYQRATIGWDIAITDDGPVLVEGNSTSNPDIAQAPTGIPLSDTPFPAAIGMHVQRTFERI